MDIAALRGRFFYPPKNQHLRCQTPKQGAAQTSGSAAKLEKISDFPCICRKKAVPLQAETIKTSIAMRKSQM